MPLFDTNELSQPDMAEDQLRQRLEGIASKLRVCLDILGTGALSLDTAPTVQRLAIEVKEELRREYPHVNRISRDIDSSSVYRRIYTPCIREAWVAISSLRVDARPKRQWYGALEETKYRVTKYL